jgi:8-oxo-dGTP diphosphatase
MKTLKVVCGIIWKDGKIFIARRKPEKSLGGYWEFPGGKIEEGEDAEIALIRELKEEFEMEVQVKIYFGQNIHQYENFQIELIAYECDFVKASFKLTDHDEYKFVEPKELAQVKLAPADTFIVKALNS